MTFEQEEHEEQVDAKKPSRQALVMRGVVAPIFGLLAVASIVFGVLNATIWKPSTDITANTAVSDTQYVVTDHGVLPLVDTHVSITVTSSNSDSNICIAVGSNKDVAGWVAGSPYTRITGLSDWTTLSTQHASVEQPKKQSDTKNNVPFKDSDMWQTVSCSKKTVNLRVNATDSNQLAIIDLGEKPADASVSFHWTRQVLPDFATPLFFIAGLFIVLTVLMASVFAMPSAKRRKKETGKQSIIKAEEVAISKALAGSFAGITSSVGKKPGKPRHRHAANKEEVDNQLTPASPKIVDPASRNMVADQQISEGMPQSREYEENAPRVLSSDNTIGAHGSERHEDAQTSVISRDEFQAYFERLARESQLEKGHALLGTEETETESTDTQASDSKAVETETAQNPGLGVAMNETGQNTVPLEGNQATSGSAENDESAKNEDGETTK